VRRKTAFQQSVVASYCHAVASCYLLFNCGGVVVALKIHIVVGLCFVIKVMNVQGSRMVSMLTSRDKEHVSITPLQILLGLAIATCAGIGEFFPDAVVPFIAEAIFWLLFLADAVVHYRRWKRDMKLAFGGSDIRLPSVEERDNTSLHRAKSSLTNVRKSLTGLTGLGLTTGFLGMGSVCMLLFDAGSLFPQEDRTDRCTQREGSLRRQGVFFVALYGSGFLVFVCFHVLWWLLVLYFVAAEKRHKENRPKAKAKKVPRDGEGAKLSDSNSIEFGSLPLSLESSSLKQMSAKISSYKNENAFQSVDSPMSPPSAHGTIRPVAANQPPEI
jgi:hypothetical protein